MGGQELWCRQGFAISGTADSFLQVTHLVPLGKLTRLQSVAFISRYRKPSAKKQMRDRIQKTGVLNMCRPVRSSTSGGSFYTWN